MSREILFEGKFWRFVTKNGWEYLERIRSGGVVLIIPLTDDQKIVFIEQYRAPVGRSMIEFPAGIANDHDDNQHESLEETAHRELMEETGYEAGELVLIAPKTPAAGSILTDSLSIYLARGLKKAGKGGGDETENIIVHEIPLPEVDEWLASQQNKGVPVDPKVFACLYLLIKHGV